jgi:hypothetical protein
MPIGDFINGIPPVGFLAIHVVIFLVAAYFAWRSFGAEVSALGWGFSLWALAEISYMTYHLNWTTFLFAHTISEVLDLFGFGLVFLATTRTVLGSLPARARS